MNYNTVTIVFYSPDYMAVLDKKRAKKVTNENRNTVVASSKNETKQDIVEKSKNSTAEKSQFAPVPEDLSEEKINAVFLLAFPFGRDQVVQESSRLHSALAGTLSPENALEILIWTKVLLITAQDLSRERITDAIFRHANGRLTRIQADFVCCHITGFKETLYSGGNGRQSDHPIIINCSITTVGIWAETKWLKDHFGQINEDWKVKTRDHIRLANGEEREIYVISMLNGEEISIYFDISQWYGKH